MGRMLRHVLLMLVTAALLAGCDSPAASPRPDAAAPRPDGGLSPDAAHETPDSAVQAADAAGSVDAASSLDAASSVDAAGVTDAGWGGGPDAGGVSDAAPVPPDAAPPPDASPADAGPEGADAEAPGPDASLRPFAVEGFGRDTVGGWQPGFTTYEVTSFDDDGPGTLREGLRTGDQPRVVTFASDGTVVLQSGLLVPSNVSVDGRGRKVVVKNRGFILAGSDEVILTNLAIEDVASTADDGVRIGDPVLGASERVVLDHLRFAASGDNGDSAKTDEAISVIFGSRDITFAWLRFESWEKAMLFGNGDASAAVDGELRVTVHHTLAKATGRRHPQARHGVFDFYSCFFDDWRMFGWLWEAPYRESFGMQSQDGAHLTAESVLFRRSSHAYDVGSQANDATRCESGGVLEARGLAVAPGGNATLKFGVGCPGASTPWQRPYPATVEPADAALQARLEAEAGNTL